MRCKPGRDAASVLGAEIFHVHKEPKCDMRTRLQEGAKKRSQAHTVSDSGHTRKHYTQRWLGLKAIRGVEIIAAHSVRAHVARVRHMQASQTHESSTQYAQDLPCTESGRAGFWRIPHKVTVCGTNPSGAQHAERLDTHMAREGAQGMKPLDAHKARRDDARRSVMEKGAEGIRKARLEGRRLSALAQCPVRGSEGANFQGRKDARKEERKVFGTLKQRTHEKKVRYSTRRAQGCQGTSTLARWHKTYRYKAATAKKRILERSRSEGAVKHSRR